MEFKEADEAEEMQTRAEKIRARKIRVAVILVLLVAIAGATWTVRSFVNQIGEKNVAKVGLKNANAEIARLTEEKNSLEAKLKQAKLEAGEFSDSKSQLQAKISEQENQLQAFGKQVKACELIRTKLKF